MHQKLRKEDFGQNGLFLENLEIVERLKPFHINSNHLPIIWTDIFFSGEVVEKTTFVYQSIRLPLKKGPIHAKLNVLSNFIKQSLGLALFKSVPYFVVVAAALVVRN